MFSSSFFEKFMIENYGYRGFVVLSASPPDVTTTDSSSDSSSSDSDSGDETPRRPISMLQGRPGTVLTYTLLL